MKQILQWIQEAHDLLHRIEGRLDARADLKPLLRLVENDEKTIVFPTQKKQPTSDRKEADFLPKKETDDTGTSPGKEERGIIFTEKEISLMPKNFQKLFRTNKVIAHVRFRKNKYYEIRVMIDGQAISASSKSLIKAKEKFIEKLHNPEARKQIPFFKTFALDWMESAAKPFVKDVTYNDYANTFLNHLIPAFGDKKLNQIDSLMLQKFLNEKGASRTTEKCFTLLRTLFAYATPKFIPFSPMQYVKKPIYIPEKKKPLTEAEEFAFIRYLFETNNRYRYNFIVILYSGLRRSELKSAVFDDDFITVLSAKQRLGHPKKLRSIPISPVFRRFFPLGEIFDVREDTLSAIFKEINDALGMSHTLHDLRKTFNTRARTHGIPKLLAQHWMGHKPSKDDVNESAYMDYSPEYQLEEIKKFDYDFPDDIFPKIFPKF